jgi:hypothetical protein
MCAAGQKTGCLPGGDLARADHHALLRSQLQQNWEQGNVSAFHAAVDSSANAVGKKNAR